MDAMQRITSHSAGVLNDGALMAMPAAQALKLLAWKTNALQVLPMGVDAKHFAVYGRSDIELSAICAFSQACARLEGSSCLDQPSRKNHGSGHRDQRQ